MSQSLILSNTCSNNFFEGVEKLLEIWFSQSNKTDGSGDARDITKIEWENVLDHVQCKILDVIEGDDQVAYLLSESSLFVSKRRIILKTCGTTLCLQALPYVIKLARDKCGLDIVADCFYSRKNFKKPDNQPHPHKTFQDEIVYLDQLLSASASYCLGRLDGDCWFLYTLNHAENNNLVGVGEPDQTLEILMSNLDPEAMAHFQLFDEFGNEKSTEMVTKASGVADILPDSKVSAFLFDPCGYSLNGLLPKGGYWTIHVTPEEEFSYVSFETNVAMQDYSDLIDKVLRVFKPGRFTMTLFANHCSVVDTAKWNWLKEPKIKGFKQLDKQVAQLEEYNLFYTNYKGLVSQRDIIKPAKNLKSVKHV